MDWTPVAQAAAGVLALAITTAGGLLIPLARAWLKEKILASQNARLAAAAETVAAELERGLILTMDQAVVNLQNRLPDTIEDIGGVSADVLRALITKGREKLVAAKVRPASAA
ncbi:hypothetical protein [Roseomonas chloroacetimidivorans]|uniref:hypothetical protein n=1 Tax=Roseomonas chloroacetimidivorans TaxID=1766656 RepID=UPI003C70BD04